MAILDTEGPRGLFRGWGPICTAGLLRCKPLKSQQACALLHYLMSPCSRLVYSRIRVHQLPSVFLANSSVVFVVKRWLPRRETSEIRLHHNVMFCRSNLHPGPCLNLFPPLGVALPQRPPHSSIAGLGFKREYRDTVEHY